MSKSETCETTREMEATRSDLGGNWGENKRKQLGLGATVSSLTTNKASFGDQHIKAYKEKSTHPGAKFSRMKESKCMILSYKDTSVHFGEMSQASLENEDFGGVATNAIGASAEEGPSEKHMARTRKLILSDSDAPIAIGRSGHRIEKGVSASGLTGERLCTIDEPTRNSFVQRSWLPCDDPALTYRVNGLPEAHMPNDVSLAIGSEENFVKPGWVHGRIHPGPMSKRYLHAGPLVSIE